MPARNTTAGHLALCDLVSSTTTASTKKLLADERATRFSTKGRDIDPTMKTSSYMLLDFANDCLAILAADFEQ